MDNGDWGLGPISNPQISLKKNKIHILFEFKIIIILLKKIINNLTNLYYIYYNGDFLILLKLFNIIIINSKYFLSPHR